MNDLTVQDLMTRDVITVSPGMSIGEAAARLARSRISAAPVVEGDAVVGMISESDIVTAFAPRPARDRRLSVLDSLVVANRRRPRKRRGTPYIVEQAMTPAVFSIPPNATVWEAAAAMEQHGIKRLPVLTEHRRLVGIISKADLVRAMARDDVLVRADVVHALELLGEATSGVRVDVTHAEVILSGVVHDAETIRKANDLAVRMPGVARVRNLIDLAPLEVDKIGTTTWRPSTRSSLRS